MQKGALSSLVLAGVMLASCAAGGQQSTTASNSASSTPVVVAKVVKTNVSQTFSLTGSVNSVNEVGVQPKQSGRIVSMKVDVGANVKAGDVVAQLDHVQLDLVLEQANASLAQAQSKLETELAGPRSENVAQAQIAVDTANQKLQTILNGPKPENVASAQAAVQSAKAAADSAAQRVATLTNPRPQTVAQAQAGLTAAQATLDSLTHPRPETVTQAQLAVNQAQQKLATIQAGPRAETVAQAQAALAQAQAAQQALKNGPSAADLQPLVIAVAQAKNALYSAQISRDAACGQVGKTTGLGQTGTQANCDAGNANVNTAQSGVDGAMAALAKAQQPPTATDLQKAQAAVDAAQAALNLAQHPYTAQDLQQAQDAVSTAQQQLALAQHPGSPQDIAKAQTAVTQAQAALYLAQHPGSPQDIASAQDAYNQAQAAVTQAEQNLSLAQKPYTDQDVATAKLAVQSAEQQLALAKSPYTQQDIDAAKAAVAQAQVGVDQAKQNIADATVIAPVDGVITAKNFSEGAQVTPAVTLVTLASKGVNVEVSVPEGQITGITVGKSAQIQSSIVPGKSLPGTVTSVAPSADTKSRTFTVKVTPTDPNTPLKPGTFATVVITALEHTDVLAVPKIAIVQQSGKNVVFVVDAGIAKEAPVTVGLSNDTVTEVSEGLTLGQEVVVQGQDNLTSGDHVTATTAATS